MKLVSNAIIVRGNRYRLMIQNFLCGELDSIHIQHMWFQHDVATANETHR